MERFFRLAPEVLCTADADGVVREVNAASAQVLGVEPGELVGRSLGLFVVEEDVALADALFRGVTDEDPTATEVLRFRVGAWTLRRIRWSVRLDPVSQLRYAVAWDVTEKQLAQTRYRAVAEASPTALVMVDPRGAVVVANNAALQLLGYREEGILGQPVEALVPEEVRARHPGFRGEFQRRPAVRLMGQGRDLQVLRKDGGLVSVEVGLSPVRVDAEVYTVVSLVDVTERNRKNQRIEALAEELGEANKALEELAVTDSLTGIWNRRKFFDEANRLLKLLQQTGGPFSVVLLDIDDFKDVNDRFGHLAGDEVLRAVGEVLRGVRGGSDIPARFGGEEFIVGLPGSDAARAAGLAERLRESVAELPWNHTRITVSVGVATLEDPGERGTPTDALLERIIDLADQALYRSKADGKNRVTAAPLGSG